MLDLFPQAPTVFDLFGSIPRLVLWKLYELCVANADGDDCGEAPFSQLTDALRGIVSEADISKSMDVLLDYGLIYPCYRVRVLNLKRKVCRWLVRAYGVGEYGRSRHAQFKDPEEMLFRGPPSNIQRVAQRQFSLFCFEKEVLLARSMYTLNELFRGVGKSGGLRLAYAYKLAANYLLDIEHSGSKDGMWQIVQAQYGPIPVCESVDEPPKELKIKDAWEALGWPVERNRLIPIPQDDALRSGALRSLGEVHARAIGSWYSNLISKTLGQKPPEKEAIKLLNALVSCRDIQTTVLSCYFEYLNLKGWQKALWTGCVILLRGAKPGTREIENLLRFASRPRKFYRLGLDELYDVEGNVRDFCETKRLDLLLNKIVEVEGQFQIERQMWAEVAAFSAEQCWRAANQIQEKIQLFRTTVPPAARAREQIDENTWIRPVVPLLGKQRDEVDLALSQLEKAADSAKQWVEDAAYLLCGLTDPDETVRDAMRSLVSRFESRQYVGHIRSIRDPGEAAAKLQSLWQMCGSQIEDAFDALSK